MFNKILIANRGEIAVRIMATCREMAIATVAVYSTVDQEAYHVRMADEAYAIGPAPSVQSYLRCATIIDIARRSGAQAIHPGYGFLAENADFVDACTQAGIVFIGPPASAMRLLGDKISAKRLAQTVGAPTVPGYNGEVQQDDVLLTEAQRIGFPLLIKASAGGGGKGMRAVEDANDFLTQLAAARREALAAFGDETVFLERLIQQPRHIEIQILADNYGHLIHLGERECSIQRRHQKILEESPSVALTPTLRAEMGTAALRIAHAAGYVNAGTLEFMLDAEQRFYFLEMNTRLQVEHPVTELVTGLDLVRHQLSIAAGEALSLAQEQISPRGHAIEVRLYAEDPKQNFLPSTGKIARFVRPEGPGIRVDSGIENEDEITQYYDPMLAKLIVYAEDRPSAIARLQYALEQSAIFGVTSNIALLHSISSHPAFQAGQTQTDFLEKNKLLVPSNMQNTAPLPQEVLFAAALYDIEQPTNSSKQPFISHSGSAHANDYKNFYSPVQNPWRTSGPWRTVGEARTVTYHYAEQAYKVSVLSTVEDGTTWRVQIDEQEAETVSSMLSREPLVLLKRGTVQVQAYVQHIQDETQVAYKGNLYRLRRRQAPDVAMSAHDTGGPISSQKTLSSPMAGTLVKVQVHEGDIVEAHQVLMILSAMKMEHAITAPYAGKVRRILYQEGSVVAGGAIVAELEAIAAE